MPFVPHERFLGVEVREDFPDGDRDRTDYHAFLTLIDSDNNGSHMEVEELAGGNTEFRVYQRDVLVWSYELPFYIDPEQAIAMAVGMRIGYYEMNAEGV